MPVYNGANKQLSNLVATAINTSLISDTDNTDDLGSSSVGWKMGYLRGLTLKGTTSTDLPTYGAEFLLDTGWTSTDWTGSFAAGWSHPIGTIETISLGSGGTGYTALDILTVVQVGGSWGTVRVDTVDGSGVILTCTRIDKGSGYAVAGGLATTGGTGSSATINVLTINNATTLTQSTAAVSGTKYQIAYTVTNRTTGTFIITFGGQQSLSISSTGAWGPTATSTASLVITPTSTFNGTIVFSIKSITAVSTPIATVYSSDNTIRLQIRANNTNYNTFIGNSAGGNNTTGDANVGIGEGALALNTTGRSNFAVGYYPLYNNTTGYRNVAFGIQSLYYNTTGYDNVAVGVNALLNNVSPAASQGRYNTSVGNDSGESITTGAGNTFVGYYAGYNALQLISASNSMALGKEAYTTASNQITLGNSSITQILFGQGSLGKWNANYINIPTAKTPASAAAAGTAGDICWDASYIYVCTATNTWERTAIATW